MWCPDIWHHWHVPAGDRWGCSCRSLFAASWWWWGLDICLAGIPLAIAFPIFLACEGRFGGCPHRVRSLLPGTLSCRQRRVSLWSPVLHRCHLCRIGRGWGPGLTPVVLRVWHGPRRNVICPRLQPRFCLWGSCWSKCCICLLCRRTLVSPSGVGDWPCRRPWRSPLWVCPSVSRLSCSEVRQPGIQSAVSRRISCLGSHAGVCTAGYVDWHDAWCGLSLCVPWAYMLCM